MVETRERAKKGVSTVARSAMPKMVGFGHDLHRKPGNGDLAYFCPACPQPGVNLP